MLSTLILQHARREFEDLSDPASGRPSLSGASGSSPQPRDRPCQARRTLDDGYGINDGDWGDRRLGAVAVAIRLPDGKAIASMSMLYTRRAVSSSTIENEFVPSLRRCVEDIELRLRG